MRFVLESCMHSEAEIANKLSGKLSALIWLIPLVSLIIGCNSSAIDKLEVSGQVRYKGESIPLGWITFQPDKSKGNSGPQGYAMIKNGRFVTNSGKGVVPGAQTITVYGYTGDNPNPEYRPYGDPMFSPQLISADLTEATSEFEIAIP